ncbi:TonB-dependent receptor plug domain-containing protein [Helicobacter sp. 23-1046]
MYSRSGGINGQITIRGQNSNNTRSVIMIDGVRFSGRSTLDFNVLDPYQFESIEVIRGAASALWGSDAMNGVINFRTRRSNYNIGGEEFSATARIRALEYQSVNNGFAGRAEILGGGNGWDVLIGASTRQGDDYTTPLQSLTAGSQGNYLKAPNSNYTTFNLDFNIGYTNKNHTRYYTQGRYSHIESHRAGGGAGVAAAPGSYYGISVAEVPITEYYIRAGVEKSNLGFADSMNFYVHYRHWDTDIWNYRSGGTNGYTPGNNIHQRVYNDNIVGTRLVFDGNFGKHYVNYGLEIESTIKGTQVAQEIIDNTGGITTSRTAVRKYTNTDFAIFAKDDYKVFDSWIISAAARGDYVLTTFGKTLTSIEQNYPAALLNTISDKPVHTGAVTGSLGSVWFITDYLSNVINISHNFQDPGGTGRMSLGASAPRYVVANPDIKPEYSQTAELGFRFNTGEHFIGLTGFFTNYHDMILTRVYTNQTLLDAITGGNPGNAYLTRSENVGRAYITGAELEGRHHFLDSKVELNYNLAYNYGHDITNNKPIAYIAPIYGNAMLKFNFDKVYISVMERFYGAKTRIDPQDSNPEGKTAAYAMTDMYAGVKLGEFKSTLKDMELIFGISNVFNTIGRNPVTGMNANYALSVTNPLVEPGRNFTLKYVWKY